MGEVYRARDTKLNRDVAIKILPDSFAATPNGSHGFTREAQTLASLNHPNIAQIHGLEESNGVRALVMELVEGEDLSQRIARGPISIDEALPIAKQIAEALEAAHEQGIIHRDLKPANIKVTPDGAVKVLDFGLAKLAHVGATAGLSDVTASPTITSPAMMTGVGVLLGTAAYMSPEQAKGREADKRSDIWAFGCVLYEMLTGRRAFDGEDMTEVLGAVVRLEPNWEALSSDVPQPVRTLLQRCLVKDRRKRIADIAAALFVLDHQGGVAPTTMSAGARVPTGPTWHGVVAMVIAAAVAAMLAATAVWFLTRPATVSVVHTTIITSGSTALALQGTDHDVAITPDGAHVVYRGNNQLLLRALNQLQPTVLSGVGAPQGVFVSPDGKWVGFFDGPTIKKVAITGGSPVTVANPVGADSRGATWGPDGTIIFATSTAQTGLQRVSDAGSGAPTVLTTLDRERGDARSRLASVPARGQGCPLHDYQAWPAASMNRRSRCWICRRERPRCSSLAGVTPTTYPTGHLIYGFAGTLRAVAFDLGRLEVVGTAAPVLEGVVTTSQGAADVAVAANGSLVYASGGAGESGRRTVVVVDRQGRATPPLPGLPLDTYRDVRVSPDGASLALSNGADVSVYDFAARDADPSDDRPGHRPQSTLDAQWPAHHLYVHASRLPRAVLAAGGCLRPRRAAPHTCQGPPRSACQWLVGRWQTTAVDRGASEHSERHRSNRHRAPVRREHVHQGRLQQRLSGRVSKRPLDGLSIDPVRSSRDLRRAVSRAWKSPKDLDGWRPSATLVQGRAGLFFSSPDGRQMFTVAVQSGTTFLPGRQQVLFEDSMLAQATGFRPYDIAPDGRFVIIRRSQAKEVGGPGSNLMLMQNWFEELKSKVPTK